MLHRDRCAPMSEKLRSKIAEIDKRLLELVAERMLMAERIGKQKRNEGVRVVSPEVEAAVVCRAEEFGRSLGLDLSFTHRLIALLIEESVRIQDSSELGLPQQSTSSFEGAVMEKEKVTKVVRLDRDEDDAALIKAATKPLTDISANYSPADSPKLRKTLKEKVCDQLNERYGIDLDVEQVLITKGGKLATFMAILALVSQGERAAIPSPASSLYGNAVRLVGGRVYSLHTSLEDRWDIDIAELEQLLHLRPKLMVLNLPNNPTGKVYSTGALQEILSMTAKAETCVLADETHLSGTSATLLQIAESNFVSVNSDPDCLGVNASGMGYVVSDRNKIAAIEAIMQLSGIAPVLVSKAVSGISTGESSICCECEKEMKRRMASATEALDRLTLKYYRPDAGMFLFPKVDLEEFDSEVFARRLLEEEYVAVTPGQAFGDYPKHFRISLGTINEEVNKGIAGIGRMLEKWGRE